VKRVIASVLIAFIAAGCSNAYAQSFHPIVIPPVSFNLHSPVASVLDVSPDGSRVAGAIIQHGVIFDCAALRCTTPFTWTVSGGVDISAQHEPVELYKTPYGSVSVWAEEVVAVTKDVALANGSRGVHNETIIFNSDGHHRLREIMPGGSASLFASAISDDSRVVVGTGSDFGRATWQPFRWTRDTGVTSIDVPQSNAHATGVSGDGRVIIGTSVDFNHLTGARVFRWTETNGLEFLPSLHSRGDHRPTGVSYDGSVIVGTAWTDDGYRAFRWTAEDSARPIEVPQGFSASTAADTSADGRFMIGQLVVESGDRLDGFMGWAEPTIDFTMIDPARIAQRVSAMIWDTKRGTRLLEDVLVNEYGLGDELAGWSLVSASAISANGSVIAGMGVNPAGEFQGWVVFIPEPSTFLIAMWLPAFLLLRRFRLG
jgi:probable HAF family extracellular repeat protein